MDLSTEFTAQLSLLIALKVSSVSAALLHRCLTALKLPEILG